MSTRMPPRGREPQRQPYRPPANATKESKGPAAPGERRRVFDFVIFAVVIALAVLLIKQWGGTAASGDQNALFNKNPKPSKPGHTAGVSATGNGAAVGNVPLITELMPSNSGSITDEKGDYCDWIELYNPTGQTINLAGFALSDNIKKPTKDVLPSYTLDPGEYVIIYADGQNSTDKELHAKFKLKNSSQVVLLADPNGNLIQQVPYSAMETNQSFAMDIGTKQWAATAKYTPGFSNDDDGYNAYLKTRRASAKVNIDEVMAGNTLTYKDGDGDYSDWVELYNSSDKDIDLTGWGLSDDEAVPKNWIFPKMQIKPGAYIIVYCSGKNRAEAGKELHTGFRLNAFKDTILLSNPRGQIVSEVQINRQKNDESFGQLPGTDTWQAFAHPTPGYPNTEAGWNEFQKTLYAETGNEPIVISEIMTNNVSTLKDQFGEYPDWIELYNRSNQSVNLKGWGLTDKSDELGRWQFPDISLSAGQYLTVFASGKNLSDEDAVSKKKLHTDFGLNSMGGIVALTDSAGKVADRCFVPVLRSGLSYDRLSGGMAFGYSTSPTPGEANSGSGYPGMAPEPVFSIKAGFYDSAQQVTLASSDPDAKIYYTTNGDTPTQSSKLYSGPIDVKKPTADFGATVIRAVAYRDGYLPSNVATSTYLIGQSINLPVLSLSADNGAMFDSSTGIYSKGNHLTNQKYPFQGANFWKKTEIPAYMELLETDGTVGISQDLGLRVFGQFSRGDALKGFALIARSEYGKNSLDYQIFPDQSYNSYKSVVLKSGGQDVKYTGMRDVLVASLVRDTIPADPSGGPSVYVQDYRTAALFVNGEFWGVTHIREKINTQTIAQHYHVDESKLDILEGNGNIVKAGSSKDFLDLVKYAKEHDLSNPDNYNYVASKMDIDSYINWFALEICCGNSDMGNIRLWKSQTADGKWRWIYYDFCWAFWTIDRSDIQLDIEGPKTGASNNRALIQALLKNGEFKQKFLKQLAYHIKVTFDADRVIQRIDEIAAQMEPFMAAEDAKWHQQSVDDKQPGYSNWSGQVEKLRKFARQHPGLLKQQMQSYFSLSDADMQRYFGN